MPCPYKNCLLNCKSETAHKANYAHLRKLYGRQTEKDYTLDLDPTLYVLTYKSPKINYAKTDF